jgi:hypothetical protein
MIQVGLRRSSLFVTEEEKTMQVSHVIISRAAHSARLRRHLQRLLLLLLLLHATMPAECGSVHFEYPLNVSLHQCISVGQSHLGS